MFMTPEDRARRAYIEYSHISGPETLFDVMVGAIRAAEKDAYTRVLSLLQEHKQCESCVVIDELEDEIMNLNESGLTARPI